MASVTAELRAVRVDYGARSPHSVVALDGVDLNLAAGTFTALVGPSGCGKSTILRLLAGLLRPTSGTVSVDGRDPTLAAAQHCIGIAFQDDALLPWLTVRRNVELAFRATGQRIDGERVAGLIDLVGLRAFAQSYPSQLSGGMRQRTALARALALDPELLLLDEPFGALDAVTRRNLNRELLRLWTNRPVTTLLVTHSVDEAVFLADRVLVMSARPGRVLRDAVVPFERPRGHALLTASAFHALVDELTDALEAGDVT